MTRKRKNEPTVISQSFLNLRTPEAGDTEEWVHTAEDGEPSDTRKQDPNQFYVCVRRRDKWGGDPNMEDRIVPTKPGIRGAHEALMEAIAKWGPHYKVVIEPVEWKVRLKTKGESV